MTDYNKYKAEGMERLQMYGKAIGIIVMIGLLFYKSIVAILLFLPFSVWLVKYQEKQRMKDRKWEFNQQFKQGLLAISSSLNAGYSVENAFGEAVKDLELVYEEKTDTSKDMYKSEVGKYNLEPVSNKKRGYSPSPRTCPLMW